MSLSPIKTGITLEHYRLFTVLGGLFGLDHFALGSMQTGFAKILINFFSLGAWWIFDIIQAFDKEKIENGFSEGLDIPYYGSAGIGKNMISIVSGVVTPNPNALFYMNILFLVIAVVISGVSASYIGKPAPYGQIASTATTITGLLSTAIIASLFQQFRASILPAGLPTLTPGLPTLTPGLPTLTPVVLPQRGGGEAFSYADPFLLGTLGLLSLAGFTLAASRT